MTTTASITPVPRFLELAHEIGTQVAETAIWLGDRCNFMGAIPEERLGLGSTTTYRSLGCDLYGGTAGIGLVLAELANASDDQRLRRTALGCVRHACSRLDDLSPQTRPGFYAGRPGVALAAIRAGLLLDAPELVELGRAAATLDPPTHQDEFDLVSGHAGAVVGQIALHQLLDSSDLLDSAVARGEALIDTADAEGSGLSWRSTAMPSSRGLAGFSHGASGVAFALLELWAATGEEKFRAVAEQAFAYEATLYDPVVSNWPDLRETPGQPAQTAPTFVTFWCHGAPGMALSRLRAVDLGIDLKHEAREALRTTAASVEAGLVTGDNFSICHGLAGNAEILLEGHALLGDQASETVLETARAGIERYADRGVEWPCGVPSGATPSLFLGLAGIARFYLRLADPLLPSLLLPLPRALATLDVEGLP